MTLVKYSISTKYSIKKCVRVIYEGLSHVYTDKWFDEIKLKRRVKGGVGPIAHFK